MRHTSLSRPNIYGVKLSKNDLDNNRTASLRRFQMHFGAANIQTLHTPLSHLNLPSNRWRRGSMLASVWVESFSGNGYPLKNPSLDPFQSTMSTAKWRNGSKSFLACSVPNLELNVLSFDIHLETPTRCVGKHFPHHFLHPEAPHISMSKLHLF